MDGPDSVSERVVQHLKNAKWYIYILSFIFLLDLIDSVIVSSYPRAIYDLVIFLVLCFGLLLEVKRADEIAKNILS